MAMFGLAVVLCCLVLSVTQAEPLAPLSPLAIDNDQTRLDFVDGSSMWVFNQIIFGTENLYYTATWSLLPKRISDHPGYVPVGARLGWDGQHVLTVWQARPNAPGAYPFLVYGFYNWATGSWDLSPVPFSEYAEPPHYLWWPWHGVVIETRYPVQPVGWLTFLHLWPTGCWELPTQQFPFRETRSVCMKFSMLPLLKK